MYDYMNGLITEVRPDGIVLEVNNIGYFINVSNPYTFEINKMSRVYLYQQVKEDELNLFGFKKKEEKEINGNVLVLDGLQDPGNLGTIIRSAVAFNVDTIILSKDTVDLYNPKVVRSTQGMNFHINIIRRDLEHEINTLKEKGYTVYSTDVINGKNIKNVKVNGKYAIIMGNEGNGVRENIKNLSDEKLYIKMNNDCESLNVGVATSIILYEFS